MSAELRFLEDRHAVAKHLEPAASRRDQFHLFTRNCITNLRRQTDGAWLVASDRAVFDRDHRLLTFEGLSALLLATVGRDVLRSLVDVQRVPVGQGVQYHRVAALRLVAPHRPDPEQHHVALA